MGPSLKLTVRTWKWAETQKERVVFQTFIFRWENVGFKEGRPIYIQGTICIQHTQAIGTGDTAEAMSGAGPDPNGKLEVRVQVGVFSFQFRCSSSFFVHG